MAISLLRATADGDPGGPEADAPHVAPAPPAGGARHAAPNVVRGASAASGIVALSEAECHALLLGQRLCVLAAVDGDVPYAVPMFYGFDAGSGALYLGISEGRKTRVLDDNARVALTVCTVGPGDAWASVMVAGRAETVVEPAARAAGVQVLMAHNRRLRDAAAAPPPPVDAPPSPARRHSGGRIVRVVDAVLTGRAKR